MSEAVFWAAVLLLAYVYVGYPALVWTWARLRPRPPRAEDWEPSVSVLVAAHDEATRIGSRIENLLGLDYPADRLEVLVGSDGSTDATVERARQHGSAGAVRVFAFPVRRGKPPVLNDLARAARGEVLVMADARQTFDKAALRMLVRPLADSEVGAVSGELMFERGETETAVSDGVGFYWRYEKLIRRSESLVDSTVGATGAIYAVRRSLYEPLPEDTLIDDVLLPMRVVRRGYRVVFEGRALAFDQAATAGGAELTRKVRTLAGNFQLFWRERWLLKPWANRLWLQAVSHKGLRLLGPALLVAALAANVTLAARSPYTITLAIQALFYALAAAGAFVGTSRSRLLSVPYTFCLLNWASVLALAEFLRGRPRVAWRRSSA